MDHNDLPTDILQGELESLRQALRQRVEIVLRQDDEYYTLKIPMGSHWRSESSARRVADLIWGSFLETALRIHMGHITAELERRAASSSEPAPPG